MITTISHAARAARTAADFFTAASIILYLFAIAGIGSGIILLVNAAPEHRFDEWDSSLVTVGVSSIASALVWFTVGLVVTGLRYKMLAQYHTLAEERA